MKRPLIKKRRNEGDFMQYFAAYVPGKESWIVFKGSQVVEIGLCEEEAKRLAYLINAKEWLGQTVLKDAQKEERRGFNFEAIYDKYPRKIGKKLGLLRLKSSIKTEEKYRLLIGAVENYAEYCLRSGIEETFIKHFSTWVNSWEDWIREDATHENLSLDDMTKAMQL